MKCPYCSKTFVLTWKMYITSPLGKFNCPICQQKSKLRCHNFYGNIVYFILLGIITSTPLIVIEAIVVPYYVNYVYTAANIAIVCALLIALIFDKFHDSNFKILKKIDKKH